MNLKRDIIVIGASLGGLRALCSLSGSLSCQFPASILVVLHTGPDSPRSLAGIIQRYTSLSVVYGREGGAIELGRMYIAPPDRHLVIASPGVQRLDSGPKVHHFRPAADPLFESAAVHYGPRAIGVVLTGGGHDGTDGLLEIKKAGGLGIVQHPAEAIRPDMPMSALDEAIPDFCVSLEELAPLLTDLAEGNAP